VSEPRRDDAGGEGGPTTTRIGSALVVTLPRELDEAVFAALRTAVMEEARRPGTRALIFETSGLDLVDAAEFADLSAAARSAAWLGVRPMLVGLSAGLVAYLVDAGIDTGAFEPFGSLEDALAAITRERGDGAGRAGGGGA
jgi:anti-anti-sigma regulatory factor